MSVATMAVTVLRSAAILTFVAIGAGGHGFDEEGADAMQQRLLALESEAGEMRRQLESLGIIAQEAEVKSRFAGALHGTAMELTALGPELLMESVVLVALASIIYAVSRGSSVPPPSKGKQTHPGHQGLADVASSWPDPQPLHTERRRRLPLREKPAMKSSGGEEVWANLQKVIARHRLVKEPQEGSESSSALTVQDSCGTLERAAPISLKPGWSLEHVEQKNPYIDHPWNRARQEMLPAAHSQVFGVHSTVAEADEPQSGVSLKENIESSLAFEFPPGLALPLAESVSPSRQHSIEQIVGDQNVESTAQMEEDIVSENELAEEDVHNELEKLNQPQKLTDLDEAQEQQAKDEEEEEEEEQSEEHVPCLSPSTTTVPHSVIPSAQDEAEPGAQEKAPTRTSTRKDRTRKVERRTAQRPVYSVTESSSDADDWAVPSPSLVARLQFMFKGLVEPAEQASHGVSEATAIQDKHGSKKVRRQATKQQKPVKTKVEQAPRWSVPRWPLGGRVTVILALLCGIVLFGRMDWDMDDVTRLRKLADLKEKHRRATEQLNALRAEKAKLTRIQALADLAMFVSESSEVLRLMRPHDRAEAARLEAYQSDASALLEALVDISEEEFPQVADSYTQVSGHWQMVLETEKAKQKRRKDAELTAESDEAGKE